MADRSGSTASPNPEPMRLDWFTYEILPDDRQIAAIYSTLDDGPRRILDATASALMHALLTELARDDRIAFDHARQAVLRVLYRPAARRPPL